jgi:Glutathione S-transferase, N-terminal domain
VSVKLHRCKNQWVKLPGHPCWRVEKALIDSGVEYERVPGPWPGHPDYLAEKTGVGKYPAIEFDDATWYREESKDMASAIRAGRLDDMHGKTPAAGTAA